jgi:hypothetical protein
VRLAERVHDAVPFDVVDGTHGPTHWLHPYFHGSSGSSGSGGGSVCSDWRRRCRFPPTNRAPPQKIINSNYLNVYQLT